MTGLSAGAATPGSLPLGVDGWSLAPEGAAVHLAERTAVVADVHLGYEWARGAGGEVVPAHSLAETIARLEPLLAGGRVARLVVAGDLVESPRPCPRTARDVVALRRWLGGQGVDLVALRGNHDPPGGRPSVEVGGWTIAHGDRPVRALRRIVGHHHPALRAAGASAPCFLVGPTLIVLPAFSPNASGVDVTSDALSDELCDTPLQCVAAVGGELLDFGPRATLRRRLQGR
jgi:putative SbcD/Mre11-related phosphoesterase